MSQTPSEQPACLHLGMPKTATTTLQHLLFAKHSGVSFVGKFDDNHRYANATFETFLKRLAKNPDTVPESLVAEVREQITERKRTGRVVVFSKEGLTAGSLDKKRRQAERLREAFGDARILITLREPLSFMEALYFQQLKGYQFKPHMYRQLVQRFGMPPRYFSFDDWIDRLWSLPGKGSFTHLEMAETADIYATEFGRDNILIKPFEQLKQDSEAFYRSLSRELGIDPDETVTLTQGRSKNVRWDAEAIATLQKLGDSVWTRLSYRLPGGQQRLKRFLKQLAATPSPTSTTARAEISEASRERIFEVSGPQCERLVRDWNCPLAAFGYPVESAAPAVKRAA